MSYILDALRKSEQERRPGSALGMIRKDPGPATLPPRSIALYAAPVLGAVALAVGSYLLIARPFASAPAMHAETPPASTSAASPSPAPKEAEPAAPVSAPKVAAAPPVTKAPTPPPVRDLVEQTRMTPKPTPRPHAPTAISASVPVAAPAPIANDVRLLRVMPPDFQRSLPEMVVNIHVYAANQAERILYINNRQYQAGDKVRDDVVVEEIVEDGAVLNFRGQRFKLPRPS